MARVGSDVVVLRAPPRWRIRDVDRILVPVGGRRDHSQLRARLLASLARSRERHVTFLRVLPTTVADAAERRAARELRALARDEAAGPYEVEIVRSDDAHAELVSRAAGCDLVIMGLQHPERQRRVFGNLILRIARETETPLILISRRV